MKLHFITTLSEKIGLLLDNKQCLDIFIERDQQEATYGSIYLAKIRNIDETMEAVFVDIGVEKAAFLPKRMIPNLSSEDRIVSQLQEGQSLLVQVTKEAYQEKGPQVTAEISISGTYLIYLPLSEGIKGSRKLAIDTKSFWKANLREGLEGGLILRTNIANAEEQIVQEELSRLRQQWYNFITSLKQKKAPYLLFHAPLVPYQMLKQYQQYSFSDITFDEARAYHAMKQWFPEMSAEMRVSKQTARFGGKDLNQWLSEAIHPQVNTQEGITLTIEQTAALSVIDIDSHKYKSRQSKQWTAMAINQQAIGYCATEIRKRNLSGIILIDFLKVTPRDEQILLRAVQNELRKDPIQTRVIGFTSLGLLEITRKRERNSLLQTLTGHASSVQPQLTAQTIAYQLQRELLNEQQQVETIVIALTEEVWQAFSQHRYSFTMDIYYYIDHAVNGFEVVRAGSQELVADFMNQNIEVIIDKFN